MVKLVIGRPGTVGIHVQAQESTLIEDVPRAVTDDNGNMVILSNQCEWENNDGQNIIVSRIDRDTMHYHGCYFRYSTDVWTFPDGTLINAGLWFSTDAEPIPVLISSKVHTKY